MKTDWTEIGVTAGIALVVAAIALAAYHFTLANPDQGKPTPK